MLGRPRGAWLIRGLIEVWSLMQVEVTRWPGAGWCLLIKYIPAWKQSLAVGAQQSQRDVTDLRAKAIAHHVVPKPQSLSGLFPEGMRVSRELRTFHFIHNSSQT